MSNAAASCSTDTTSATNITTGTLAAARVAAGTACTNQAVTGIGAGLAPTCNTITSAYVDTSIAKTGTDVNTSNQVTATHLAAALPQGQGGWGALDEEGTINNAGSVACGTALGTTWTTCHFSVASGASFTMANPVNVPTNALVIIKFTQVGGGVPTITWGSHFFSFDASNQTVDAISGQPQQAAFMYFTATAGKDVMSIWSTDASGNLTAFMGANELRVNDVFANQSVTATSVSGVLSNGLAMAWSGTSATIASSGTDYISFGQNATIAVNTTQANAMSIASHAGTAANLVCFNSTAAQAGGVVYTVYGGAAGTTAEALTCTANSTVGACSASVHSGTLCCNDLSHNFAVTQGDLLSIKVVNSNAANATGVTGCSFTING